MYFIFFFSAVWRHLMFLWLFLCFQSSQGGDGSLYRCSGCRIQSINLFKPQGGLKGFIVVPTWRHRGLEEMFMRIKKVTSLSDFCEIQQTKNDQIDLKGQNNEHLFLFIHSLLQNDTVLLQSEVFILLLLKVIHIEKLTKRNTEFFLQIG